MAKNGLFHGKWPIFDIFLILWPYLCSKQDTFRFDKQATHRRPGDEPFFYFGVYRLWLGMAQKWAILDQHDRLVNVPKWPKRVHKGRKWTKMANLSVFDHLWPFRAHLDPFGSVHTKMNFLPQMDKVGFGRGASEQKINFYLKWSKRSTIVKNT